MSSLADGWKKYIGSTLRSARSYVIGRTASYMRRAPRGAVWYLLMVVETGYVAGIGCVLLFFAKCWSGLGGLTR